MNFKMILLRVKFEISIETKIVFLEQSEMRHTECFYHNL